MKELPEVLSPVGNLDTIYAAINGGADAVYFGLEEFSARRNANNIKSEDLMRTVLLCHQYGIKAYLAFNILIKDEEFPKVIEVLNIIQNSNVDGLIIQDMGLALLIQNYYSHLKLQTSTQVSVYGIEDTLFFQENGFVRVVLPREMSIDEIKYIRSNTGVQIKVFCHGALCFAYSGECLMSSLIGGRSGNRGLCAQPCRKKYKLYDISDKFIKEGYLLSLKDLNTLDYLRDLVKSKVHSLKIEGRMKSPEYVYAVTKAYRDALNNLTNPKWNNDESLGILKQVFNRDFSKGMIFGEKNIINDRYAKKHGIEIGKITKITNENTNKRIDILLKKEIVLNIGDGIAFGESQSMGTKIRNYSRLNNVVSITVNADIRSKVEDKVYLTYNRQLMSNLINLSKPNTKSLNKQKIGLSIKIKKSEPVELKIIAEGYSHIFISSIIPEIAEKNSLTREFLTTQLEKLGNTNYQAEYIEIELEEKLFLKRSDINSIRNNAIKSFETQRSVRNMRSSPLIPEEYGSLALLKNKMKAKNNINKTILSVEPLSLENFKALLFSDADEIVLPIQNIDEIDNLHDVIAECKELNKQILLTFPRITNSDYTARLKEKINIIMNFNCDGILIKNYGIFKLFKDTGIYMEADHSLNLFNSMTVKQFTKWNIQGGVFSFELKGSEIKKIADNCSDFFSLSLPVYGKVEAMVARHCIFNCGNKKCEICGSITGYIQDEKKARFPFYKDDLGITHIYNGDTLDLAQNAQIHPGIKKWRIYWVDESFEKINKVISSYKSGIETKKFHKDYLVVGKKTKGNYKRGVE